MDNNHSHRAITVFGGARVPRDSARYAEAYAVGAQLAQAGFTVVNGGYSGTMEASAQGAREAGGQVIGVTSKLFKQITANEFVNEEIPTDDLYDRICELVAHGDGFVVLHGSIGTLAELHLVWNLAALEPAFNKPIVLLGDFWQNVMRAYTENLAIGADLTRYVQFANTPEECVALLERALNHS